MNPKGADLFISDTGTEVSVRTSRDISTGELLIEPLYATDMDVLDGATGELRVEGETLRGTLRRNGGAFVVASAPAPAAVPAPAPAPAPEPVRARAPRRKREPRPPADPVVPVAAKPTPSPAPPPADAAAPDAAATPDAEVLAAAITLSRFVRGERDVPLKAARQAHTLIGQFLAGRERQARARK